MKKIIKSLLSLMLVVSFNSCSDGNTAADEVLNTFETGAILRTLDVVSGILNSSEPSSEFSVSLEEQDGEDGALFKAIHVYASIKDLTPGNGTTVVNDMFVKTIEASTFSPGPHGLPRGIISVTFAEAESAMGLNSSQHEPGDIFIFELKLELTDGRIYGSAEAGGSVTGGFFDAPHKYNALISCTPEPGDYVLDMQDGFGDGWQSDGIGVSIDGVTTDYRVGDEGTIDDNHRIQVVSVPAGTSSLTWQWYGDSWPDEVSFQVYAPDGSVLGIFQGTEDMSLYSNGFLILEVDGVAAQIAEVGLLPILLCSGS